MTKIEGTIGERIAMLRKINNLTQLSLAEKLNISDKAVSKWESNKGDPSLEMVVKLSEFFNCSTDYIVKGIIVKNNEFQKDVLYDDAKSYCIEIGKASAALLQNKFNIGYSRAAYIIDQLEENRVIEPASGKKYRKTLISN